MDDLLTVDPVAAPLQRGELRELARLTAVEDERSPARLHHGPVEGIAVLRRRMHGAAAGMLEVICVPAFALVVANADGTSSWGAQGLDGLDDQALELFLRRGLQLVAAVTREQARREVRGA
jgi:hypothetical protein